MITVAHRCILLLHGMVLYNSQSLKGEGCVSTLFLLADGKIVNLRKRGGQHCHVIPFLRAAAAVFIIQYEKTSFLKEK